MKATRYLAITFSPQHEADSMKAFVLTAIFALSLASLATAGSCDCLDKSKVWTIRDANTVAVLYDAVQCVQALLRRPGIQFCVVNRTIIISGKAIVAEER
jgi:hypothetical protein